MKKTLYYLFIICSFKINAQDAFGIKFGLNATKELTGGIPENQFSQGFEFGGFYFKNISKNIILNTEILYSLRIGRISKFSPGGAKTFRENQWNTLAIPMFGAYRVSNFIFALGGELSFYNENKINVDYGLLGSIKYSFKDRLFPEIRFIQGLSIRDDGAIQVVSFNFNIKLFR
jgi:hypothetical protein